MNKVGIHQQQMGNSPAARGRQSRNRLPDLVLQIRQEIELVNEPRFQALLETSAEVLGGRESALSHSMEGRETAWRKG
jgi:hypothetical protein